MDVLRVLIGCTALIFIALFLYAFLRGMREGFTKQGRADSRRKAAHRGLVTCQAEVWEDDFFSNKCDRVAIYVTPNGYFCGEHADENSGTGKLRSKHMLNHELKKYDPNWKAS